MVITPGTLYTCQNGTWAAAGGGGGGGVTGSGAATHMTLWTGAGAIGDSPATYASSLFTFPNPVNLLAQDTGGAVYNVKAYGAVGNGSTNDCTAITNTVAAMTSGGVLFFPQGNYIAGSSCHITLSQPTIIQGVGKCDLFATTCASKVSSSDTTGVLFTFTTMTGAYRDIALVNTAASPTAGAAILTNGTSAVQRIDCRGALIAGFYDGADMWTGGQWVMDSCDILNPVRDALSVQNTIIQDSGNWTVVNSWMLGQVRTARAGIYVSGGNAGIIDKTVILGNPSGPGFANGVDLEPQVPGFNGLTITNSSIQEMQGVPILVNGTASAPVQFVNIANNQLNPVGAFSAIVENYSFYGTIEGGVLQASTGNPNITITHSGGIQILPYAQLASNTTANSVTTSTNINDYSSMNVGKLTLSDSNSSATGGELTLSGGTYAGMTFNDTSSGVGHMTSSKAAGGITFITPVDGANFGGYQWMNAANSQIMALNTSTSVLSVPTGTFATAINAGNANITGTINNTITGGANTPLIKSTTSHAQIEIQKGVTGANAVNIFMDGSSLKWDIGLEGDDNFDWFDRTTNRIVAHLTPGAPTNSLVLNADGTTTATLNTATTATTQSANDNSTKIATTAYVNAAHGISNAITSATGGSGTGTVTCASAACTNLRGNYTVAGGTFATGTLLALVWPTTTTAYVCTASVLNNATGASIGYHSIATATGMNITSLTAATGLSVDIDYSCQP